MEKIFIGYYCTKCDLLIPEKYIHGINSISYSRPTDYESSYPCHRTCLTKLKYCYKYEKII